MEGQVETNKVKIIVTHNGPFHCDEVFSLYLLTNHTKEFRNAKIIRSRRKEDWSKADALVDLGGEFDVSKRRFDHHQRGFNETFSKNHTTKLSSAGITFKYYGKEVIEDILTTFRKSDETDKENVWTSEDIEELYNYIYSELVESVDAVDNGESQYEIETPPRYRVLTDLSSRIGRMNANWDSRNANANANGEEKDNNELEMSKFEKAMKVCGEELVDFVRIGAFSYLPARNIVKNAIENRQDVHESGQIIEIHKFCSWLDHLFQLEKLMVQPSQLSKPILYAIIATDNNQFCVRAVPQHPKSMKLRKPLKEEWCGVADAEIERVSGIAGLKFVHPNGFIGGARTRSAALALAIQSLPR